MCMCSEFVIQVLKQKNVHVSLRVGMAQISGVAPANPDECLSPGANPLVAERAFPTKDYWGLTGVARCAEEMTGICRDFQ